MYSAYSVANSRLRCFDVGSDDGLEKLTIRVLVAAIHQLRQGLDPIGSLIVDAGEIERAQRVMSRTDDKQTGKSAVELFELPS